MLTAGLFLKEFVGEGIPWAHVDIAGPAFNEGDPRATRPRAAPGTASRTLLALVESYAG